MNEPKRVSMVWVILAALCAVVIVFDVANGDDDSHPPNDLNSHNNTVKGDIGYVSRAYALSGGDMYIRDCLATHSILFGLWQGTHINKLCESDRLNRDGMYQAAAEMKCSIRSVRRIYGKDKCVVAVKLSAPPPAPPIVDEEDDDEDDDWKEALNARMAAYEERTVKAEAEAKTARRQAQRVAHTAQIVQQAPDEGVERRAKARAALKGEK